MVKIADVLNVFDTNALNEDDNNKTGSFCVFVPFRLKVKQLLSSIIKSANSFSLT